MTPALACRRHYTDAERIRPVISEQFEAVVVVEVVARTGEGRWRAVGQRTQTVAGEAASETYEFEGGDVVESCGALFGPPKKGEAWVLYLNRRGGGWKIEAYYPWDLVFEHDDRLGQLVGAGPRKLSVEGFVPAAKSAKERPQSNLTRWREGPLP